MFRNIFNLLVVYPAVKNYRMGGISYRTVAAVSGHHGSRPSGTLQASVAVLGHCSRDGRGDTRAMLGTRNTREKVNII